jgi:hypothetical protein
MSVSINGTSGVTFNDASIQNTATKYGMVNRIINGAMMIDQRNAGASLSINAGRYSLDRWYADASQASKYSVQQNAGTVTPPMGFTNYLGSTSASAYSVLTGDYFYLSQSIEGFNIADLGWGTANASPVTLSFWVRSSLTGTFGGAFTNNGTTRSYAFSYNISASNTWEQKSITITGDTSGTWSTNNNIGINVRFGLGVGSTFSGTAGSWQAANLVSATGATSVVGTNGATFYITGVQLEKGSTATSFDYRPYGTELALCQRYFTSSFPIGIAPANNTNSYLQVSLRYSGTAAEPQITGLYSVAMRATPTVTLYNPFTGTAGQWSDSANNSSNARAINDNSKTFTIDNTDVTLNWNSAAGINFAASAEL